LLNSCNGQQHHFAGTNIEENRTDEFSDNYDDQRKKYILEKQSKSLPFIAIVFPAPSLPCLLISSHFIK
jgi:hypothetical protein